MCAPPVLALAAAGMTMVGQGVSAYSTSQAQGYAARVADQNARLSNAQALDAIKRGQIEDQRNQQQTARAMGSQRAAMAANDIDPGYGNAADVVGDTATFGAEDSATIRENAMREAKGYEAHAANFRAQAASARMAATGAIIGGAFNMASTALGAAQQYSRLRTIGTRVPPSTGGSNADWYVGL